MFIHRLLKRFFMQDGASATPHEEPKALTSLKNAPRDPLEPISRGWDAEPQLHNPIRLNIESFPIYDGGSFTGMKKFASDAAVTKLRGTAMDDDDGNVKTNTFAYDPTEYGAPASLHNWYLSQGFIGYQTLAIMAQQWLVNKACTMAGEDAARNGWTIRDDKEKELDEVDAHADILSRVREFDDAFSIKSNLVEFNRFKNIFGIRVAMFVVESDDPEYYKKPFNPDGITEGSYKGISQIDPYWMTPMMTTESTADPASIHFYEPEFWNISGKLYHRSHLCIARGPQTADILKPTYLFGGVSLVQQIYERVYAAERTANEAPLLAMNKRTTAIHVDTEKAIMNEKKFIEKLAFWVRFRDNHAVKVLGQEETMEQFDTSLADFDNVIMSQYQLVASIARTPATKLLGTPPKGFNATGEFEMVSYHEELESIQENVMDPMLSRHYLILSKSLGLPFRVKHVWESVDSVSMAQQADINSKKADTDNTLITAGIISPDEARNRLRGDRNAGYTSITSEDAETTPGMSPENVQKLEEGAAKKQEAANGATPGMAGSLKAPGEGVSTPPTAPAAGGAQPDAEASHDLEAVPAATQPDVSRAIALARSIGENAGSASSMGQLVGLLEKLVVAMIPEGKDIGTEHTVYGRSSKPSTQRSIQPTTAGLSNISAQQEHHKLPKVKLHGMVMAVENPRGSIRKGTTLDGANWSAKMAHHYGFIKGIMGADGDELDCFIGPNMQSTDVYVINQNDPSTGEFDEHKVMFGFNSSDEALKGYQDSFSQGWTGFDSIVPLTLEQFRSWTQSGACTNPLSEVNFPNMGQAPETN